MIVHYNLAAALIANLCGALILLCLLLNSHMVREMGEKPYNKWMASMIIVCLVGCFSEMIYELINGNIFPFARQINFAMKTINHTESIFAGFLFVGYMRSLMYEGEKRWPKVLRIITTVICVGGAILLVSNIFTGILFTVSEDNVYARGPLGQLGLMISLVTLLYTVVILFIDNKNTNTYLRFPVLLYILPFLVGGGLQMMVSSLRLSNAAFALGIATAHLSVQRTLLYTDGMTEVYNRSYLDYFFRKATEKGNKKTFAGIMIDINSFKAINDTYGHLAGDEAIKNAAKILKRTSGKDYLIVRYGGDEFILIKEEETAEAILSQKANINLAVKEFNEKHDYPYELAFAIGTTVFETASGEFDSFLEQMDKSLYLDKKEYYEKTGKERRK